MRKNDLIRLRHMLDSAEEAISFAQGHRREDMKHDRMLVLSVVKAIEIIGEAASQIAIETRDQIPDIPWPSIVGMRNRLVHAYFDIDLNAVWDTLIDDLPPLIAALERILRSDQI